MRGPWRHAAWVALFAAIALALRCYRISHEGVWWDEYHVFGHFRNNDWWLAFKAWRFWGSDNAPLHTVLAYAWYALVDPSVTASRVFSVLISLLSFPLLYGLTLRAFGSRAAAFACAMLTLSPHHAWYAQAIRPYAMMEPLALASWWAMLEYLRQPRGLWMALCVGANILLLFTHPLAVFLFGPQFAFLAWQWRGDPRRLVQWCAPQGVALLLLLLYFLPVRPFILEAHVDHLELPGAQKFFVDLLADDAIRLSNEFWFPLVRQPGQWMASIPKLEWLLNAGVFIISTATLLGVALGRRKLPAAAAAWLLLAWLVPSFLMLGVSIAWRPLFEPRYVYYCSVALYPLTGAVLARLDRAGLRLVLQAAVLLVLAGQFALLAAGETRPPWPQVAADVVAREQPGDAIFVKFAGPCNDEIIALTLGRPNEAVEPGYSERNLCRKVQRFLSEHPDRAAWVVLQDEGTPFTQPGGLLRYFPAEAYDLEEWQYASAFNAVLYRVRALGPQSRGVLPPVPADRLAERLPPQAQEAVAEAFDWPLADSKLHYYVLAASLLDEGLHAMGLAAAEAALAISQDYPPAQLMKTVGLAFQGDDAAAWQVFETACAEDGVWLPMFEPFMRALLRDGNPAAAAEEYRAIRYIGLPCRALEALLQFKQGAG
jgi:4-amino-4-deoxy-L-arabinose transferase-like glycosyltransferase